MVCFPTYGGSGILATELGHKLLEKGYELHFISSAPPSRLRPFHPKLYYHEVDSYEYPLFEYSNYALFLASKIVEVVKFYGLDILHVHYAIPHATAAYLAREILKDEGLSLPIMTTLHGTDITLVGKHMSFAPVVRFSINVSDVVTAVSDSLRREILLHFKPKVAVHRIYNFVDTSLFSSYRPPQRSLICRKGERVLIHISNLREVKRPLDVIEIFYKIQQRLSSRLIVVGDGPARATMEERSRSYGIMDKVFFSGKSNVVHDMLHLADLFLLPSAQESFGLAALEAMAARTPVIASRVGGLTELIEDGRSGFLCEVGDIDKMVEQSIYVLDSKRLDTFKAQAFLRAKAFDIEDIVPQYERLYNQLLQK